MNSSSSSPEDTSSSNEPQSLLVATGSSTESSSSSAGMASSNEPRSSSAATASNIEPSSLSAATASSKDPLSSSASVVSSNNLPISLTAASTELVIYMEPADWERLDDCLSFTCKDISEFKWPAAIEVNNKKKIKRIAKKQKNRMSKSQTGKEGENEAEKNNAIDVQKLSKGDDKGKKKVRKAVNDPRKLKTRGIVNMDGVRPAERKNEKGAEKRQNLDYFTKQANTDEQMITYIETVLKRRRGQSVEPPEEEEAEFKDIDVALSEGPEHLEVEAKPMAEGNVHGEAKPVTEGIAQLYTHVRINNIKETEKGKRKMIKYEEKKKKDVVGGKAKRKMIEDQQKKKDVVGGKAKRKMIEDQQKEKDVDQIAGSNNLVTDQLYQGRQVQSYHEYHKVPNLHAPHDAEGSGSGRGLRQAYDRDNLATDDIVPERLKKRTRR